MQLQYDQQIADINRDVMKKLHLDCLDIIQIISSKQHP